MNEENTPSEPFVPLRLAAIRLGVPAAWLKAQVAAGRVPHLRVGRRVLFNPQAVELVLMQRAQSAARPEVGRE